MDQSKIIRNIKNLKNKDHNEYIISRLNLDRYRNKKISEQIKKAEYYEETISDVISRIDSNQLFLPALQRKFVWKTEQIEGLFDSIMQGYPIGTFLFWELNNKKAIENYLFYEFVDHYHQRNTRNEEAILSGKNKIVSVLDGQQRLTSLNIALRGTYSYKIIRKHISNPNAYPKRQLYLNLLPRDDEDFEYEFKFLTEEESCKTDSHHIWYRVNKVLTCSYSELSQHYKYLKENNDVKIVTGNRNIIIATLKTLHKRICRDKYIAHFDLRGMSIDEVLDIFIRVNSGGTKLSKSDLLMSTITASWDKARDEVEDLIDNINMKGRGFKFDIDFIMRACLVLLDLPVLFKVRSFGPEAIQKIRSEWKNISFAVYETVDLLIDFGFDGLTLTSRNAVIPITYYVYNGGSQKSPYRGDLKKYLQRVLLTGYFGSHGDQALSGLRDYLRKQSADGSYILKKKKFSFNDLKQNMSIPGKTLEITEEYIDTFLEYKKGKQAFMVLSLLYPDLQYNVINYDQDHIHPAINFRNKTLRDMGLSEQEITEWKEMKDQVPNLQMMDGRSNKVKNKTPFGDWLEDKNSIWASDQMKGYLHKNYIPEKIEYGFANFNEFFILRKKKLKKRLLAILVDL